MSELKAYLTIDDTPSLQTGALADYLCAYQIPALLYCRGDRLSQNLSTVVDAIAKGLVIGNHAYNHRRSSTLSFEEVVQEIIDTDCLIDEAYEKAGVNRPGKYFRFPHMDRGCGGWVVDYDAAPEEHREKLIRLFGDGLNISMSPPHEAQRELKDKLQEWLRTEGFASPFKGVTFPWYAQTEMATAIDAMFTFSTSDWMITPRHAGKWPYKTLDDLKRKIDEDEDLQNSQSNHIILMHDQDDLLDISAVLLTHFIGKGYNFLEIC